MTTGLVILILTCIAALILGALVHRWDTKVKGHLEIDKKNLSWRQMLYSACFAYPFCAIYFYLEMLV